MMQQLHLNELNDKWKFSGAWLFILQGLL
jgi:hypothetical protein